jgi:hypothetical protein
MPTMSPPREAPVRPVRYLTILELPKALAIFGANGVIASSNETSGVAHRR